MGNNTVVLMYIAGTLGILLTIVVAFLLARGKYKHVSYLSYGSILLASCFIVLMGSFNSLFRETAPPTPPPERVPVSFDRQTTTLPDTLVARVHGYYEGDRVSNVRIHARNPETKVELSFWIDDNGIVDIKLPRSFLEHGHYIEGWATYDILGLIPQTTEEWPVYTLIRDIITYHQTELKVDGHIDATATITVLQSLVIEPN